MVSEWAKEDALRTTQEKEFDINKDLGHIYEAGKDYLDFDNLKKISDSTIPSI